MLLLRLNKASPLLPTEVDDNFIYLDDRITSIENNKVDITSLLTRILAIDGAGSLLDADKLHGMSPTSSLVNTSIVSRNSSGNFSANIITADLVGNASTATLATSVSGIVTIANGGTGVASITSGYVKSNGSILSSVVNITGSDISGNILGNSANVTGVIALINGGTGATTAAAARSALGLVLGQTVQSYSPNLLSLAAQTISGFSAYVGNNIFQSRTIEVGNSLEINNGNGVNGNPRINITVIPITQGGTGSTSAATARNNLGALPVVDAILQGVPTAPTAALHTSTLQLSTTAFVQNAINIVNQVLTGTVITYAGTAVPAGYLKTDGTGYLRTSYAALFALIGTTFGTGNDGFSFQVPNISAPANFISIIKI